MVTGTLIDDSALKEKMRVRLAMVSDPKARISNATMEKNNAVKLALADTKHALNVRGQARVWVETPRATPPDMRDSIIIFAENLLKSKLAREDIVQSIVDFRPMRLGGEYGEEASPPLKALAEIAILQAEIRKEMDRETNKEKKEVFGRLLGDLEIQRVGLEGSIEENISSKKSAGNIDDKAIAHWTKAARNIVRAAPISMNLKKSFAESIRGLVLDDRAKKKSSRFNKFVERARRSFAGKIARSASHRFFGVFATPGKKLSTASYKSAHGPKEKRISEMLEKIKKYTDALDKDNPKKSELNSQLDSLLGQPREGHALETVQKVYESALDSVNQHKAHDKGHYGKKSMERKLERKVQMFIKTLEKYSGGKAKKPERAGLSSMAQGRTYAGAPVVTSEFIRNLQEHQKIKVIDNPRLPPGVFETLGNIQLYQSTQSGDLSVRDIAQLSTQVDESIAAIDKAGIKIETPASRAP